MAVPFDVAALRWLALALRRSLNAAPRHIDMSSTFSALSDRFARSSLPLLVLVMIAGGVDALVMLHSKDLLAVYMTGNTTKLGQSIINGAWSKAWPTVVVIVCFFAATTAAAWIGTRLQKWRACCCLAFTAAMLACALPLAGEKYPPVATCLIAAGMGAINQARADQPGVTFITGVLVRAGRKLADGEFGAAVTLLLRWLALLTGAIAGTAMDLELGRGALAVIAIVALLSAVAAALYRMTPRPSFPSTNPDGASSHARHAQE
jgi:uncharacterized membrane protein YoaK (UPF0700 family)